MRCHPQELVRHLQTKLAAVYLLSGDEPLQLGEAADAIRLAARRADFSEREVLSVDSHFAWHSLLESAGALSIFADKKIIDLRVPDGKLGIEGGKALQQYCKVSPPDTLLLITMPKLSRDALKASWFASLEKYGVVVQVQELEGRELLSWLQQRAASRGVQIAPEALKLLAGRIEGNLLAAAQEIEKLFVLFGSQLITPTQMQEVIADSSRFDVFKLVDSVLQGNGQRVGKILFGLKDEGIAAPIVLWGLTREARVLQKLHFQLQQGTARDIAFRNCQIWDKRKDLINHALARVKPAVVDEALLLSAHADQQIKGLRAGDSWETLLQVALLLALGGKAGLQQVA